jgi:four helix bundle protein
MDEAELKQRTKRFALRCIKLADSLPNRRSANIIAGQLIRCGTSVGANYRAACRGRSIAEFIAKLGTVEEESDESSFWMELIIESGMKSHKLVQSLHDEAEALTKIMVASIRTARAKSRNPKSPIQNPK